MVCGWVVKPFRSSVSLYLSHSHSHSHSHSLHLFSLFFSPISNRIAWFLINYPLFYLKFEKAKERFQEEYPGLLNIGGERDPDYEGEVYVSPYQDGQGDNMTQAELLNLNFQHQQGQQPQETELPPAYDGQGQQSQQQGDENMLNLNGLFFSFFHFFIFSLFHFFTFVL